MPATSDAPTPTPMPCAALRRSVLVVDDDVMMRRFLTQLLSGRYQVHTFEDGNQALAALEAGLQVELAIVDLEMAGLDGASLVESLRRGEPAAQVPILVLSGVQGSGARVHLLGVGADDFVAKPFSPAELLARIEALLRRAS